MTDQDWVDFKTEIKRDKDKKEEEDIFDIPAFLRQRN